MTADDARVWSERSRNGRHRWWAWQIRRDWKDGWMRGTTWTCREAHEALADARAEIEANKPVPGSVMAFEVEDGRRYFGTVTAVSDGEVEIQLNPGLTEVEL